MNTLAFTTIKLRIIDIRPVNMQSEGKYYVLVLYEVKREKWLLYRCLLKVRGGSTCIERRDIEKKTVKSMLRMHFGRSF